VQAYTVSQTYAGKRRRICRHTQAYVKAYAGEYAGIRRHM
jgi:hypothetical protein